MKKYIKWTLINQKGKAKRVEYKDFSKFFVLTALAYGLLVKALSVAIEFASVRMVWTLPAWVAIQVLAHVCLTLTPCAQ